MVGACAGASCLPSGGSHSTYNYIASNSSNAGLQSKDNRAAFGGMKKGFLENMTNNSRDGSSNVGGGGGSSSGGGGGGISNSSSNNSGATGSAGASGGCNNKRSNETKNLIDCNQIGSKKTYNKDMPFIKPKNTDVRSSSFELHEELENIREKQTLLNSTEWVTDALLTRLQSNPNLIGRLSDPTFIEAITDFQKNPQSAMAKYQGDKDLQASMQEFCSILGDHLLKLDKKDGTHKPCNLAAATPLQDVAAPSSASSSSSSSGEAASSSASLNHMSSAYMDNEHRMQDLLTDPEIREALVDKKVQEVIAMQSQNPERAQSMLHQGDAELRKKVRKLVDAGLLTFNS
uniref:STI1/HOP DP domain-containing protein n=2 Tax=Octopus bimaculoides TaxID=37653 RepID=A0A0L8HAS8_OCTBM